MLEYTLPLTSELVAHLTRIFRHIKRLNDFMSKGKANMFWFSNDLSWF